MYLMMFRLNDFTYLGYLVKTDFIYLIILSDSNLKYSLHNALDLKVLKGAITISIIPQQQYQLMIFEIFTSINC